MGMGLHVNDVDMSFAVDAFEAFLMFISKSN